MNVWLALASRRHADAGRAARWMDSLASCACFCRVTQSGLLRLLTNPAVMGADVLDAKGAWRTYDEIVSDVRIEFIAEPSGLEAEWRLVSQASKPTAANWTDSYLLAFARAAGLQLATFDKSLARRDSRAILL